MTNQPCDFALSRHNIAQSIKLLNHVNDLFQALWAHLEMLTLKAFLNLMLLS